MRLNEGNTAALARCVRHLDEILTHGLSSNDTDEGDGERLEDEPLAVRIPPSLSQTGEAKGARHVRVVAPAQIRPPASGSTTRSAFLVRQVDAPAIV